MSRKFPNLSWMLWSGKKRDGKLHKVSSVNFVAESNEPKLGGCNLGVITRRVRRKRRRRDQGKIDKEHNSVVVLLDGGGFSSDSESDGSDWSIGWSEPHAPGFLSEDEIDGGFGVLVRCYGRNSGGKPDNIGNNVKSISNVPGVSVADSQKHMER